MTFERIDKENKKENERVGFKNNNGSIEEWNGCAK